MKLLIVTAWYHPLIHPRAHRWTALAEYWASEGHEVHIVSARRHDCSDEAVVNGVHVHRTGFDSLKEVFYYWFGTKNGRGRVGVAVQKPGFFTRLTTWIYNAFWKKIYFPDDACLWYFPAKEKAGQLLEQGHFDALITVSLPFTGHLIGLTLIRPTAQSRRTDITWLADIGDPFSFQAKSLNNSFLYGKISRRFEQKVLESADAITVTTAFTLQKYGEQFGEAAVKKMHVIPPLLHPTPDNNTLQMLSNPVSSIPGSESPIRLGYFGALYSPVRTPHAFLDLLERTFVLMPALRGQLEVHFYGEIFPEFFEQLAAQPAIRLHGLCSRAEVQSAMREMDVLLNIGNSTDFQLPSKVVDYVAAGKPVLHLSYTEEDPFADFFSAAQLSENWKLSESSSSGALILNLKVTNGRVGERELRRWLVWLEEAKNLPGEADIRERITPYLAGTIAKRYQELLNASCTN